MALDLSFFNRGFANARLFADLLKARKSNNREAAQALLTARMGSLHGLPQKLGQSLAMSQGAPLDGGFATLNENSQALPFAQVEACLEAHWGKPWRKVLRELDPQALAASLGQVHRAVDLEGRVLAVKLAYPGIRQAVLQDLRMLGWLGKSGGMFMGFDWSGIRDMLLQDLQHELDYRLEAQNQAEYRKLLSSDAAVAVPAVVAALSGEHVLVSQWLDGVALKETLAWPEKLRASLAKLLVSHSFEMLFDHGLVHADPHPGNYRFREYSCPTLVLYDFGSVARFSARQRLLLLKLIHDTLQQNQSDPLETMVGLGFQADLLIPIREKLPAICRVLFEPFLYPNAYEMGLWQRQQKLDDILGDARWNFRFAGPPEMIFLVRMFQGVLFYLRQWQVSIAWQPILLQSVARHRQALNDLKVDVIPGPRMPFAQMARNLQIKLTQHGQTKVKLSFPVGALDRLDLIMGPEISEKVKEAGIQVEEIVRRARAGGMKAQQLFEWQDAQEKVVSVWLE